MYKLTRILYNYVLGKKHILHGRYADLTFLFKIMDFHLKNPNGHCTCSTLSITSQAHWKT